MNQVINQIILWIIFFDQINQFIKSRFSDNPNALGAPENFEITIREVVPKLGAGFIVALTGDVMTMPGLPKRPAALNMDVSADGTAIGLF